MKEVDPVGEMRRGCVTHAEEEHRSYQPADDGRNASGVDAPPSNDCHRGRQDDDRIGDPHQECRRRWEQRRDRKSDHRQRAAGETGNHLARVSSEEPRTQGADEGRDHPEGEKKERNEDHFQEQRRNVSDAVSGSEVAKQDPG
jgi:hypothetical protein